MTIIGTTKTMQEWEVTAKTLGFSTVDALKAYLEAEPVPATVITLKTKRLNCWGGGTLALTKVNANSKDHLFYQVVFTCDNGNVSVVGKKGTYKSLQSATKVYNQAA